MGGYGWEAGGVDETPMMRIAKSIILLSLFCSTTTIALPEGFVYLNAVDPSIQQEIRYASDHNFVGHSLAGYKTATCILTQQTAQQLQIIQTQLNKKGLSLKVYDCYRPTRAVEAFYQWSQRPNEQQMKAEFYPRVDKSRLFDLGYIARQSGHSRGSTVDLTIIKQNAAASAPYKKGQSLSACYAPYNVRYRDNSIDMGTGYDCLDSTANISYRGLSKTALDHRQLLHDVMLKNGFESYSKEWWHFTLKNEPYPRSSFNFTLE